MPNKQEKQKLVPQPSEQERNKLLDESMQRAYAKVAAEMPDVKRVSVTPRTSSFMASLMMPRQAYATTNPFTGNITYNPELMQGQSPTDIENTLAHELTHVRQTQNMPWYEHMANMGKQVIGSMTGQPPTGLNPSSPLNDEYYWRPFEMDAFQTEKNRALSQGQSVADPMFGSRDIMLPRPKKQIDVGPSNMRGR